MPFERSTRAQRGPSSRHGRAERTNPCSGGPGPEGSLLAAKQFLALGQRDAVDQALRRLAARGKLVKITRGRYALPVCSRFGTRPPAPELVIAQLMACPALRLCRAAALDWCHVKNAFPMTERGFCFEAVVAAVAADGLLVVLVQPAAGASPPP